MKKGVRHALLLKSGNENDRITSCKNHDAPVCFPLFSLIVRPFKRKLLAT